MFFLLLGLIMSSQLCGVCSNDVTDFLEFVRSGASFPKVYNGTMKWCDGFGRFFATKCKRFISQNIKIMYYEAKVDPWCDQRCICEKIGLC